MILEGVPIWINDYDDQWICIRRAEYYEKKDREVVFFCEKGYRD